MASARFGRQVDGPATVTDPVVIGTPHDRDRLASLEQPMFALPSGRSISCDEGDRGGELVTIRSPDGKVELEVLLTDAGPVLRFEAAQMELRSAGAIRAECQTFEVTARADIVQRAGGELRLEAVGDLSTRARITTVTSTRGDVALKANDDVKLNGERVMLNC